MLQTVGVVMSIGLADSVNPSTVGPALYLASGQRGLRQLVQFTLAAFIVYFLGGVILTIGPGQLLIGLVPNPPPHIRFLIELGVGLALLIGSGLVWRRRRAFAERGSPRVAGTNKSGAVLGASIMAAELPTAFPYFAAVAVIVGSGVGLFEQLILLGIFNICFVLPLLAVAITLLSGGKRARRLLTRARRLVDQHWPRVLAGGLGLIGAFALLLGATGLIGERHGAVARAVRQLHSSIKL
jgi:cytochrome c biogenesis protein CcdA